MATHRIIRDGVYLRINGKLQKAPIGHEFNFTTEQGSKMVARKLAEAIEQPKPALEPKAEIEPEPEVKKPKKRGRKPKKKA